MRLTICAENLLLLHPLIARLSTEIAAFFCFSAFSSPACLSLDAFRCSLLLLVTVIFTVSASSSFVVAHHGLSLLTSASPAVTLQFSHLLHLLAAVVGFLVVLLFCCRPLILSLQLVVAIVGLPLVYFSFS